MNIFYLIISLIFPAIFLYPQGLLYGAYLNYIYVIICVILLLFKQRSVKTTWALKYFVLLFLLNLFGSVISLLIGRISMDSMINGCAPFFMTLCVSFIISNIKKDRLYYLIYSLYSTFIVVLLLILLDGTIKPQWMYEMFYAKNNDVVLDLIETFHHRAIGSLLSPVMSGFFCATLITYSLIRVVYLKFDLLYIGIFCMAVFGLILTASRTSILAVVIMSMFFFLFVKKGYTHLFVLILMSILLILFMDFSFLNEAIENLVNRNEQLSNGVLEGTGRSATFISALKYKYDVRCLLWGIGSAEYSMIENTTFSFAHNGLLSIFLPFGLIGVILYYRMLKRYIRICDQWKDVDLTVRTFNLFVLMWLILTLGTFFSADMPVSYFYIILQSVILTFSDRFNDYKHKLSVWI